MVKVMGILDILAAAAILSLLLGAQIPWYFAVGLAGLEILKGLTSMFSYA